MRSSSGSASSTAELAAIKSRPLHQGSGSAAAAAVAAGPQPGNACSCCGAAAATTAPPLKPRLCCQSVGAKQRNGSRAGGGWAAGGLRMQQLPVGTPSKHQQHDRQSIGAGIQPRTASAVRLAQHSTGTAQPCETSRAHVLQSDNRSLPCKPTAALPCCHSPMLAAGSLLASAVPAMAGARSCSCQGCPPAAASWPAAATRACLLHREQRTTHHTPLKHSTHEGGWRAAAGSERVAWGWG